MSNLSSTNEKYEDAKSKYQALASMYTGNSGYQNSLNNAAKGSTAISAGVASQTKAAARNAGLSKSAAAALGQSNVQKAYTDAFTGQQENAYKAGTDAANAAKDVMSNEVTEGNNRYDRAAGNTTAAVQGAGTLASSLLSDETMKDKLVNLSNGLHSIILCFIMGLKISTSCWQDKMARRSFEPFCIIEYNISGKIILKKCN